MFHRLLQSGSHIEIDNLYVAGIISNKTQIVDLPYALGFVKVRPNDAMTSSKLSKFFDIDLTNEVHFDGVKFKEQFYEEFVTKSKVADLQLDDKKSSTTTSTSVQCSVVFLPDIKSYSDVFHQIRLNQCSPPLHRQYDIYCHLLQKSLGVISEAMRFQHPSSLYSNMLPDLNEYHKSILNTVLKLIPVDERSVQLCCALLAPAFGIPLSNKLRQKVKVLIDFYCKYQHLADSE
ncbi:unnamed protein product, partial [Didymodactylos carnosus]